MFPTTIGPSGLSSGYLRTKAFCGHVDFFIICSFMENLREFSMTSPIFSTCFWERSGVALVAAEKFSEPREVEKLVITPVKKELGLTFKGRQKNVVEALEAMTEE